MSCVYRVLVDRFFGRTVVDWRDLGSLSSSAGVMYTDLINLMVLAFGEEVHMLMLHPPGLCVVQTVQRRQVLI